MRRLLGREIIALIGAKGALKDVVAIILIASIGGKNMELNKLIEIAKATLREKGSHNTILILIKDGKPSYYTLMFRNLQEKLEMQDAMRKVVELTKPEKYFVITDSWYAVQDGSMPSIRPSLRKDRKEALTLSEFNRDMTGKQAIVLYDRLGKRIKFHKPQIAEFKDMHSQFNFYLEKEGIDEAFDNEAKKVNE